MRQTRGAVVRELSAVPSRSLAALAKMTGFPVDRVTGAVRGLADDGVVRATGAALEGNPRARVRLAD